MGRRTYLAVGGPFNGRLVELDRLEHGQVALLGDARGLRCAYGFYLHAQSRLQTHAALTFVSVLTEPADASVRAEG